MNERISYWDVNRVQQADTVLIGAGYTGLRTARLVKEKHAEWDMVVLDRLPVGAAASTRNAGFGCFGSPSEILADLKVLGPNRTRQLLERRIRGIEALKLEMLEVKLELGEFGGYEVFYPETPEFQEYIMNNLYVVNDLLDGLLTRENQYKSIDISGYGMAFSREALFTNAEFQLNPADLHQHYTKRVNELDIPIIRGVEVVGFRSKNNNWELETDQGNFLFRRVIYCGNGGVLSKDMSPPVDPGRGQIVLTEEIEDLPWKGNFHLDEGYYYFRNYDKKVLLGGARNMFREEERTQALGQSQQIQNVLDQVLKERILAARNFRVDRRWSGTMGFRRDGSKEVVVQRAAEGFWSAYGFGGMGVALHVDAARQLTDLIIEDS